MHGPGDDDEEDADVDLPLGSPLPPDDRLWRHPSELSSAGLPSAAQARTRARPPRSRHAGRRALGRWLPLGLSGAVGALLTTGLLAVTGSLGGGIDEQPTVAATSSTMAFAVSTRPATGGVADLAERLRPSLLAVTGTALDGRVTRGSAVAIRRDFVLTAARLVLESSELHVLVEGAGRRATLVGTDADTDLAVLAVEGGGLAPISWGASATLRPGDPVVAVSIAPSAVPGPTVTTGIVSGLARTLAYAGTELRGLLQVDRPVPLEGAGGSLVDPTGALVGITLPAAPSDVPFGYAVPAEVAREVSRQLLADGRVAHPWLGVEGSDRGMNGGALVQRVKPGSPADKAGLLDGDVVTAVDGVPVPSMGMLLVELRLRHPGDMVRLLVVRGDALRSFLVTLADRPVPAPTASATP